MAAILPPLSERLAAELAATINQVEEPYRASLLAWLDKAAGRDIHNLNGNLSDWLAGFDGILMIEQYALIRCVCQYAKRIFEA